MSTIMSLSINIIVIMSVSNTPSIHIVHAVFNNVLHFTLTILICIFICICIYIYVYTCVSVCVFSVLTPFSAIAAPSSVCAMSPLQAALLLVSGVVCVTSSLQTTGYIDYYPGTTNTP